MTDTPNRVVGLTFERWAGLTPDLPPTARDDLFRFVAEEHQSECWSNLAWQAAERTEWERQGRPVHLDEDEPQAEQTHQPAGRSTAASPTRPGTVAFANDDPLKNVEPRVYVEALCGVVVPANGWLHCPLPEHEERTPSFQVLASHWRCFGCNRGGSVIDLAAAIYGVAPRGQGYWDLRDLIIEALTGAPHNSEEDR